MTRHYRLPGTRIGAKRPRDIPRVLATAAWLMGPAAWMAIGEARRGTPRAAETRWAKRAAKLLDIRLRITGLEHIDPAERYVIAPLHEGFADAVALLHLPLDMRFVGRTELLDWRVLGRGLRAGGHPVVEPERPISGLRELLRRSKEVLKSESLVVFPQGTILGIESAFTAGAFYLANTLDRPLLPISITGSHRVWEHPFSPVVRFGQSVHLQVLPAVSPDRALAGMRETERRVKRLALDATPPPRRFEPLRDGWWDEYRYEIDSDFQELAERVAAHRRSVSRASLE